MATYFQINLRGGATRVIATTDEVATELNSLSAIGSAVGNGFAHHSFSHKVKG